MTSFPTQLSTEYISIRQVQKSQIQKSTTVNSAKGMKFVSYFYCTSRVRYTLFSFCCCSIHSNFPFLQIHIVQKVKYCVSKYEKIISTCSLLACGGITQLRSRTPILQHFHNGTPKQPTDASTSTDSRISCQRLSTFPA